MLSVMCDLCFERENLLCCCSPYTHVTHSCATGSRPSSGAGKCFSTASKSDNMSGSQRKCPIIWTQSSLLTEYELVSVHCPEKKARERQGHYSGARCFQVCQLIHGILISLTRDWDWDAGCLTHTHTHTRDYISTLSWADPGTCIIHSTHADKLLLVSTFFYICRLVFVCPFSSLSLSPLPSV